MIELIPAGTRHSSEIHANSETTNTQLPSNQHTNLQNSNPEIKKWLPHSPILQSFERLQQSQNRYSSSSGMQIDLSNIDLSSYNSRPTSHISTQESLNQANQASAPKSKAERIKNALPWISATLGVAGIIQLGIAPSAAANTLPPLTISGFSCLIGSALACSYYIK